MSSQPAPSTPPRSSDDMANMEKQKPGLEQDAQQVQVTVHHPAGFRLNAIILGLVLSFFLSALDMSITTGFRSTASVRWYGSAFALTLPAFQSHWGKAYLYFPLNSVALIVGRAVQGAGAAGITAGCYTIVNFIVSPSKVPGVSGLLGSVFTLASVAGPLLGGAFTSKLTWRWCFWINLPVGGVAIACLAVFFKTPDHSRTMHGKLTWAQIALHHAVGGVSKSWGSSEVIGSLVCWFVMSVVYAINEWYMGDKALIVYRILKNRAIALCRGFIFFFVHTLCFHHGRQVGYFQPFLVVRSILQTIGVGLYYTFGLDTGLGPVIGYQIIFGIGTGLGIQTCIIVGQMLSSMEDRSMTMATIIFFQFGVGAYGTPLPQIPSSTISSYKA
ncbi:uncharacterized protein JN550_012387 [Neoarthrinium moseri]|uniref:uncharacterized protein n=1 Tax=Neoarthrinium moseri TaxID=1658444 RepID=UPI001FDC0D45|nr:uncharacterized protein JN550_012387 [Neoarthrinium moseri]KAI1858825.1 hypothetical protein JN550_012387 [Neoarthrinium moseri]